MKDLPEFKDISEEEDRKAAYEKFIKRQQVSATLFHQAQQPLLTWGRRNFGRRRRRVQANVVPRAWKLTRTTRAKIGSESADRPKNASTMRSDLAGTASTSPKTRSAVIAIVGQSGIVSAKARITGGGIRTARNDTLSSMMTVIVIPR